MTTARTVQLSPDRELCIRLRTKARDDAAAGKIARERSEERR